MRIAFFDFIAWSYSVRSPFEIPLGGTQSAICYLAIELAKLGHEVTLFNRITSFLETDGVRCVPIGQATQNSVKQLDVAIVSAQAHQLRKALGGQTPLILWTQHAHDQPAVAHLSKPEYRNDFDGFAMVSNWQMNNYCRCFDIDPARCSVMRNAVSPAFEQQFSESRNILTCKETPPILVYTSTPFRGLDLLLPLFSRIRSSVPGVTLKVFSSMKVYQHSDKDDKSQFGDLYQLCVDTEGVEYIGSVTQPMLAKELKAATILAYPNTFEETSCISVMEAMASGCFTITSNLGALPETAAGFAQLVPVTDNWSEYGDRFVAATVDTLRSLEFDEQHTEREQLLERQVAYVNENYTWRQRALEWEKWLASLLKPGLSPT